jgi:hypothetical protein
MASYLVFREKLISEINHSELKSSDLAVLIVDAKESTLFFNESISLIDKLTAQRQVNSIIKAGFLLKNNMRVGTNSNLKINIGSIPVLENNEEEKNFKIQEDYKKQEIAVETKKNSNKLQEIEGPIIIPITKEKKVKNVGEIPFEEGFSSDSSEVLKTDNISKKDFSIRDIFIEEQKVIMAKEISTSDKKPEKSFDELVEYFWKELFGQVYSSWDELPLKAREDFFTSVNIKFLNEFQVQELFALRHENNISEFKKKLDEFRNSH